MLLECMQYKFNHTTESDDCQGSYEQCARPVKCQSEANEGFNCFSVWRQNTTSAPFVISAGCQPIFDTNTNPDCDKNCTAKPKGDNFYCCCNEPLCNRKENLRLPPKPLIIDTPPQQEDHAPPSSHWGMGLTVIVSIVIILFLVWLVLKLREKFKKRAANSNVQVDSNDINLEDEMNELRELRETQPMTLFPSSSQRQSEQIETHLNNSNSNNNNDHITSNQSGNIVTSATENLDGPSRRQLTDHHDADSCFPDGQGQSSARIDLKSIKLLEVIGSGRFGTVHKALLEGCDKEVAVKIIQACEQQSWLNELQIFSSPGIKHPNILEFLGTSESSETPCYWLIVELASKGSLYSYLRDHVVTWNQFLHIALGISHGLSHLHDMDIAHRDFKSKNVLLREDLTPCITDFGVASILDTSVGMKMDHKKKYLQVGTPRYMAPEVLECSVLFTNASFKKIDVYALALVLWELLSRCYPLPTYPEPDNLSLGDHPHLRAGRKVDIGTGFRSSNELSLSSFVNQASAINADGPMPYKLPFEDEAGESPDIMSMNEVVLNHRPLLKHDWKHNYPISVVCRLCEDGWEYDFDARISASCFVERVENLSHVWRSLIHNVVQE